jgi:hypothetical protein
MADRFPHSLKVGLAVLAAALIVAVPHLLTVDRGLSDIVAVGDVHPCPPLPGSDTYRVFVRNISCDDGTSIAAEVLGSKGCDGGRCVAAENYACRRTPRSDQRLFWLCRRHGGGAKVRFIISAKGGPAGT